MPSEISLLEQEARDYWLYLNKLKFSDIDSEGRDSRYGCMLAPRIVRCDEDGVRALVRLARDKFKAAGMVVNQQEIRLTEQRLHREAAERWVRILEKEGLPPDIDPSRVQSIAAGIRNRCKAGGIKLTRDGRLSSRRREERLNRALLKRWEQTPAKVVM